MSSHFDWQRAVLADKSLQSGTKLVILVIGVHWNKDSHTAYPSYKTIADEASMSRRSVVSHVELAVESGWLRKEVRRKSETINDSNVYRLSYPNSDVEIEEPSETIALPSATIALPLVQPLHHPSATTALPLVQPLHPNTQLLTPKVTHKKKTPVSRAKKDEKTFAEYRAEFDAKGQAIIGEDDPIYSTAEQMGLPDDYIAIAWAAFVAKYVTSEKKYTDWKATFRNAVANDWLKVWNINRDGEYFLTTTGKMIEKAMQHGN